MTNPFSTSTGGGANSYGPIGSGGRAGEHLPTLDVGNKGNSLTDIMKSSTNLSESERASRIEAAQTLDSATSHPPQGVENIATAYDAGGTDIGDITRELTTVPAAVYMYKASTAFDAAQKQRGAEEIARQLNMPEVDYRGKNSVEAIYEGVNNKTLRTVGRHVQANEKGLLEVPGDYDLNDLKSVKGKENINNVVWENELPYTKKLDTAKDVAEKTSKLSSVKEAVSGVKGMQKKEVAKAAFNSGKGVVKTLARAESRQAARTGAKLAATSAAKWSGRAALATAFPVGTIVSAALILTDPMIFAGVNKVIDSFSGTTTPDPDTPPTPPLEFLALCNDGNRDPAIRTFDKQMVEFNNSFLGIDANRIWPATGPNVIESLDAFPTFYEKMDVLMQISVDAADAYYNTFKKFVGEDDFINKYYESITEPLDALISSPQDLIAVLASESTEPIAAIMDAYNVLRDVNFRARADIAGSDNIDTYFSDWCFGLFEVANPFSAFTPDKLEDKDFAVLLMDLKAAEQRLTAGVGALKKASTNWNPPKIKEGLTGLSSVTNREKDEVTGPGKENKTPNPGEGRTPSPGNLGSFTAPGVRPSTPSPGITRTPGPSTSGPGIKTPSLPTPGKGTQGTDKSPSLPDLGKTGDKKDGNTFSPPEIKTPGGGKDGTFKAPELKTPTGPNMPDHKKDFESKDIGTTTSGVKPTEIKTPTFSAPDFKTKETTGTSLPTVPQPSDSSSKPVTPTFTPPATKEPNIKAPTSPVTPPRATPSAPSAPAAPASRPMNPVPAAQTGPAGGGSGSPNPPAAPENKGPNLPKPPTLGGTQKDEHSGGDAPAPQDPAGNPESFSPAEERETTKITRDGVTYDLLDKKAAHLANLLSPGDGKEPMDWKAAAKEAGFNVPPSGNPGTQISPMDLKPGDMVIGDKEQGVYVGDGKVLTPTGVKPLAEVATFSGAGQGYFRLDGGAVDASSGSTGQQASAQQDFTEGKNSKESTKAGTMQPGASGGAPGVAGLGSNRGVTPSVGDRHTAGVSKDPFDPVVNNGKAGSDIPKIKVTGNKFSANVHSGD